MPVQRLETPLELRGEESLERVFAWDTDCNGEELLYLRAHTSIKTRYIMQPDYGDCRTGRHTSEEDASVMVTAISGNKGLYAHQVRRYGYLGIRYPLFDQRVKIAEYIAERRVMAELSRIA